MPRVKQRTPELREHVLDVAIAMLAADGVTGFTTRRLAQRAQTSTPAVYELFGDKAGLLREVFFAGFRLLRGRLGAPAGSGAPLADLISVIEILREFVRDNPVLAQVMFSRPFADFDPGPAELQAGSAVRELIVARVRRCTDAGVLAGRDADIAHVLLALVQGLAAQEAAGWLGTSRASVDRRWELATGAVLRGLSRTPAGGCRT